ncbi:HEXXH motif-containing putative peptide modification protein [Nocardia sp. NPDC047648]|uniref:aKG-HExxH-type peptide beta-hydroxylase n=1 Tax=Nocardia sp. NPDC047648 TaxID=3155625 RepID=UPI00340A36B1
MSEISRFLTVDDEIRQFRTRRARFVRNGLESLGLDHPVIRGDELADYAIANEVAFHLRESIENSQDSEIELRASAHELLEHSAGALVSVDSVKALQCTGLDEDQCMFSRGIAIASPSSQERELLGNAMRVLERTGNLQCFRDTVGVVAVLGIATPGAPTATWATGGLPYVVHLHLMPRAELVARDLIHEATHAYLNDWLASRGLRLDPYTPAFWSPWKDTKRPLFGFVHSIMAFSIVTAFLASVMADDSSDWSWLRPFHGAERDRLRSCEESVASAVSMLPDDLGKRVAAVYALAVE